MSNEHSEQDAISEDSSRAPYLDHVGDLEVGVEVRMGGRRMAVAAITSFAVGDLVALDTPAGEALDLFVGNVRLGSAEVIIVDGRLAVRITRIDRGEFARTAA